MWQYHGKLALDMTNYQFWGGARDIENGASQYLYYLEGAYFLLELRRGIYVVFDGGKKFKFVLHES